MAALESLRHRPKDILQQDEKSGSFAYSGKPMDLHPWLWQFESDMLQITMLAEAEAEVERRKAKRFPLDQPADAADSVGAAEGTVDGESEQAATAAE
eukprot:2729398-Karenia_brevis.AAC.1